MKLICERCTTWLYDRTVMVTQNDCTGCIHAFSIRFDTSITMLGVNALHHFK
jgi:hypothetical protein